MQRIFSRGSARFSLPLSARVSLLLVLATLLPLLITITSGELLSRPRLIAQANAAMETDAQTHIQTIESFFSQPIIDVRSLSQDPALASYLSSGGTAGAAQASNVLARGYERNTNYLSWSLIDLQGKQRLFYPVPALPHGAHCIPPDTVRQLAQANSAAISSDYYNPQGNQLTADITEPITVTGSGASQIAGYLRATVNISFIWNLVQGEQDANGVRSYAFIADENGVIIAHTDVAQSFTAMAPLTPGERENIRTLNRYGAGSPLAVTPYGAGAGAHRDADRPFTFQMVPPGRGERYQVIGIPVSIVPWTYFVLSPTSVVTALADQQLLDIGMIGALVLALAALIGIVVGRRITSPVARSVTRLQSSGQRLKGLAAQEEVTLTQQAWIVESSRTGLSAANASIDVSQQAASDIIATGRALEQTWCGVQPEESLKALRWMVAAAEYVEGTLQHQRVISTKLVTTQDLTKHVTDQLNSSAKLATDTAEQMDQVVSQLQRLVGGRPSEGDGHR
jgi:C4-dicarboxylate-specific signal transduction histidine kinase